MAKHNILALDGGDGGNIATVLAEIDKQLAKRKNFLNKVNLFAGTSSGGINALLLAKHNNPVRALPEINQFWVDVDQDLVRTISPERLLGAVGGFSALALSDRLRVFLMKYFGEETTLGDLKKKVLIVTFQLDNEQPPPNRSWKPKIYNNFPEDPDCEELAVDVALRTSALPIVNPIYQGLSGTGPGFIDGAVVANNPAMIALAETLNQKTLHEILLLSVGVGRRISHTAYLAPPLKEGNENWGYAQWLLDIKRPFLLFDLIFHGLAEVVNFQCQQLIKDRFCRLELDLEGGNGDAGMRLQATVDWLNRSGWFGEPPPAAPPALEREPDDLRQIEGIGPKISGLLQETGITSFAELAAAPVERLKQILGEAGIRIASPDTWPEQAGLAAAGQWAELAALQQKLKGGRRT